MGGERIIKNWIRWSIAVMICVAQHIVMRMEMGDVVQGMTASQNFSARINGKIFI